MILLTFVRILIMLTTLMEKAKMINMQICCASTIDIDIFITLKLAFDVDES